MVHMGGARVGTLTRCLADVLDPLESQLLALGLLAPRLVVLVCAVRCHSLMGHKARAITWLFGKAWNYPTSYTSQINFYELSKQRILSNFSERHPFFLKMRMWSDGISTTKQLPNGVLAKC